MKFRVVLWYMARRMELLARTSPEFIGRLQGRNFVLQITTDEDTHRYFRVYHNRVESRGLLHEAPSLTLHFKSDETAFKLMSSSNPNVFMTAMQAGDVKFVGDYSLLMWFMSIGKLLRPKRPAALQRLQRRTRRNRSADSPAS